MQAELPSNYSNSVLNSNLKKKDDLNKKPVQTDWKSKLMLRVQKENSLLLESKLCNRIWRVMRYTAQYEYYSKYFLCRVS